MRLLQNRLRFLSIPFFVFAMAQFSIAESLAPFIENQNGLQNSNTYSFKELNWDDSLSLNGYKPSYTFYLPIAKEANIKSATLHLKLNFSPQLSEGSRLDLKFNNRLIQSIALSNTSQYDIDLPLVDLNENWQALNFSAYLQSSKNLCDPNLWIYISPESSLTINTLKEPFKGTLNQLPSPFLDPTAIKPVPTTLVLLNNQSPFHLFKLAFKLGLNAENSKVDLIAAPISEFNQQQKRNLIAIGTKEQLLNNNDLQLNDFLEQNDIKDAIDNKASVLVLNPSPLDTAYASLTFTAKEEATLDNLISSFLTPEFNSLLAGNVAIIDEFKIDNKKKTIGDWYKVSLKELNYENQSVTGLGNHRLSYSIPLPNDRIPHKAKIKTLITAPVLENKDYSNITLLVNNQKQDSLRLDNEHTAWQVEIDNSALKPGVNQIDYLIDLHLEKEQCTRQNYEEIWATIHAESVFETSFSSEFPLAMLNQLPVPFSNDLTVVLPNDLNDNQLKKLTDLFFKLGQLFEANPIRFNLISAKDSDEEFIRHNNVILLGTAKNNNWINFALPYMPVSLTENTRSLKSDDKEIKVRTKQATGLLELMPSPWTEKKAILLIVGNNEDGLKLAIDALIKDETRNKLNGNIALVNADKTTETFNSYDNRYINLQHRAEIYFKNKVRNIFYYLENHPQIFIYLLALAVPLVIFLRRRKK